MAPTLVGTPVRTGYSISRSPGTGNVAAAGVLQADDIIAVWIRVGVFVPGVTIPAGWINPLGGTSMAAATSVSEIALLHVVTAAEVTAGTVGWTLTNLFSSTQTGALYTVVVRGADSVVDAFGTAVSGGVTATHVLAGLLGTDISYTGGLILSGVGGDTTTTYATAPTGWTFQVKNAGGQNTGAVLSRDTGTTAGTNVASANITAGTSSNYASITLAFQAPVVVTSTDKFFLMFM